MRRSPSPYTFQTICPLEFTLLPTSRRCAAGGPRGFAFVEFGEERSANECIAQLHGKQLDGWELRVERSKEKRKTADEMIRRERTQGGGGGGGYGGGGGGGYGITAQLYWHFTARRTRLIYARALGRPRLRSRRL